MCTVVYTVVCVCVSVCVCVCVCVCVYNAFDELVSGNGWGAGGYGDGGPCMFI